MSSRLQFTLFILISLMLHAIFMGTAIYLSPAKITPTAIPVELVEIPKKELKKPPPRKPPKQRAPQPTPQPEPQPIPTPERFGNEDEIKLPQTAPAEKGKNGEQPETLKKDKGPLPFLTQRDIDDLAKRGLPEKKQGDDSYTLDTDEFKFISYNRWLKSKVEGVLNYPELAAISGYQGTLYIKFEIMKDGSLGALELIKSSGYKILDDEALRSIRSAAPFQPLPDNWGMDRYPIRAAVLFYLNGAYIR